MTQDNQSEVSADAGPDSSSQEYLIFTLGTEEYAMDILKVQEIRGYDQPTTIANAPLFLKGMIDLRGTIVPIIDLRIKFALDSVEYNAFTVVIILNLDGRVVGIVVDGVADVMSLRADQIRPKPEFSATVAAHYIDGFAKFGERNIVVINIGRLMLSADMALA